MLAAAFSPDGTQVVTAGADGSARIWSALRREMLERLQAAQGLSTLGADGTARIWDWTSGRQLTVMHEPAGDVMTSAAFSPDGTRVVTASDDGTGRIWKAAGGGQLVVLREPNAASLESVVFSPDGRSVLTAADDGTARSGRSRAESNSSRYANRVAPVSTALGSTPRAARW